MSPRKILAIKLRSLGDTVLMTAPLVELRRAYPQAEIHVAVLTQWAPLLEGHSAVNKVWTYERYYDPASRAKAVIRLALKLRHEKYDLVLNFHASPSSARVAFATGAPVRSIHFHGHRDRNRHTTVEVPGKGILKPIIERDMDTVRALGIHVPAGRMPLLEVNDSEKAAAAQYIQKMETSGPLLGLGLGASRPTKSWPLERFAALAIAWAQSPLSGSTIAFVGSDENDLGRDFLKRVDDLLLASEADLQIRSQLRKKIRMEQGLPLRRLAAVFNQLNVYTGNDSGPKHIAVAVNTPTVTLFGPEDPFEWHPYPREKHPLLHLENLACRKDAQEGMPPWCALTTCEVEAHRCMREIGVNAVMDACKKAARL